MWSLVPQDSDLRMTALAKTSSNWQRECYVRTMSANIQLKKNVRESQRACRQDYLIGGKPSVVK
jgi:hypothetical protein